jgi:branched-chain amino acid transport system substrate-binding protein
MTTVRRASAAIPIVLAAVIALTVSACSSGKSSGLATTSGAASSLAVAAPTGDPILVGTICSCSGVSAASTGPAGQASKAWAQWVNSHGGLNGHPVKLFQEDDGGNATQALQLAKKLVEQDHVIAVVG